MAIAASSVLPSNSLEDFRLEFNNLVSDVTGITATNKFDSSIIFEGSTADAYETTLTVTDPTADRTITIPNATGTLLTSASANPASSDGAALGSTSLEWSDLYLADGGVIYFGNDQDVTLTHVADTGIRLADSDKLIFGDGNDLTIMHDGSNSIINDAGTGALQIRASQINLLGGTDGAESMMSLADDGAVTIYHDNTAVITTTSTSGGTLTGTWATTTALVPDASDGAALGTTSLEWSDLYLADGAVIGFGDDQDVTLTHVADAGLLLNSSMYLTFRDSALKISSSADGQLDIDADTEVEITATTVDLNGNLDVSGTYTGGGLMTTGGNIVIPNDGNIGSVGDTDAIAISSSGVVTFSQTPVFSGDSTFSDDISLSSDSAVINFGADSDVNLTHVHNTGLLLNSTMAIQFNDASQYINAPSNAILDINATDEIELNATTIDINGAVEISGATTQTGISTSAAKDVFNAGLSVKNGSTSAGFIEFFEDSDNGTNKVTLIGPSSTSDVTITLPSSSATLATSGDITALAIALG